MNTEPTKPFTGRVRRRTSRRTVLLADKLARLVITLGGVSTILAVSMVFVFLVWVALPLLSRASIDQEQLVTPAWQPDQPWHVAVDEYRTMGWTVTPDGTLHVFRLDTGELFEERQLFPDAEVTAGSFAAGEQNVAFAFADGTIRIGTIDFHPSFIDAPDVPEEIRQLDVGDHTPYEGGVIQRISPSQFRLQQIRTEFADPIQAATSPIRRLHHLSRSDATIFTFLTDEGRLELQNVRSRRNLLTGKVTFTTRGARLPYAVGPRGVPRFLLLSGRGDNVYAAWENGHVARFDTRSLENPVLAEERDVVEEQDATLTAMHLLLGQRTLITGDSRGRIRGWFVVRNGEGGESLQPVHEMPRATSAVTALSASHRSRIFTSGDADGHVRVYQMTNEQLLIDRIVDEGKPITAVAMAPKDDGLLAATRAQFWQAAFDPVHPEVTLASLFQPLWYEGYEGPRHVWQSSGGTEDLEPKFGLMPLVFGTIKATVYSMMFGAPLALLAAIYTSEFLHPRWRSRIKAVIEVMASLPSVVLGFLAALVLAPFVEHRVTTVITCFLTLPLFIVGSAYLWQLLPYRTAMRMSHWKLPIMLAVLPLCVWAAIVASPLVERWMFAGNMMRWLDGQIGDGRGAWMMLLLPLSALAMSWFITRSVNTRLRVRCADMTRPAFAMVNLAKFVIGVALTLGMAYGASLALAATGLDPRGTYVDTYVQRNALVVGFVMGFAVIPIIYTIAEDALTAVPDHLRSASLGAGATPWQTAVRVVMPVAMSGLFSAMMIGLGRAVGETMIVLMAAGNTPLMDWNVFNGFRTLSANIAVELPEAVRDSTHYRTLFLAALTLFVMTFAVNTIAELVRLRFRRRAVEL